MCCDCKRIPGYFGSSLVFYILAYVSRWGQLRTDIRGSTGKLASKQKVDALLLLKETVLQKDQTLW